MGLQAQVSTGPLQCYVADKYSENNSPPPRKPNKSLPMDRSRQKSIKKSEDVAPYKIKQILPTTHRQKGTGNSSETTGQF